MRIDIMNLQNQVKIDKRKVTRCAEFVLKAMNEGNSELSLVFVDDAYIKKLNWKYRKVNSKTDVLAFPMREGPSLSKNNPVLGDVVISIETAKREANKRRVPVQKEISLYLIHGILHLLGYGDKNVSERKRMREKEKELLEVM